MAIDIHKAIGKLPIIQKEVLYYLIWHTMDPLTLFMSN